jgi:hypothetical protein
MRYRCRLALALLTCASVTHAAEPSGLALSLRPLLDAVTQAGAKRVAVVPLTTRADGQPPRLEPVGRLLAAELSKALSGACEAESVAKLWHAGQTLDAATAGRLRAALGDADLLIDGRLEPTADALHVTVWLTRLPSLERVGAPITKDLAWDADLTALSGLGYGFEETRGLRPSQLLPNATKSAGHWPPTSETAEGGPFKAELLFNGEPRPLDARDGRKVLAVAPGEVFTVRLSNDSPERVGVALYLDGLNSIGRRRETPSAGLKWIVGPRQSVIVAGWQIDPQTVQEFRFEHASGTGAADAGWITASFFAEAATTVGGAQSGAQSGSKGDENRDLGTLVIGAGGTKDNATRRVAFASCPLPAAAVALRYEGK